MSELRRLQEGFLHYLRHGEDAIEADIIGKDGQECRRRLSIYYNAYRIRLRAGIEMDHPVLGRYLGDEGFDTMAAAYIDAHPSAYRSLRHFADRLPVFLRETKPFSGHPVLSEIAAFERRLLDVFDAADDAPLAPSVLASLPADRWPALTFRFHPSLHDFVTEWNAVEIWQALTNDNDPPDAVRSDGQAWLMWRSRERLSEFRSMTVDEYQLLTAARDGANFAELCESLLEWHAEDDVAARALSILRVWLSHGVVVDLRGA